MRAKAANAMAGQLVALVTLIGGAAGQGVDEAGGAALAGLAADGRGHLEVLTRVLHGERDREEIDKAGLRRWTAGATAAATDLESVAAAMGFQGPFTSTARLVFTGRRSQGQVTAVADTGMTLNNAPRIRVEVEVRGEDGQPVVLCQTVVVSRLAIPRIGETVEVAHDPADPEAFAFRVVSASVVAPPAAAGSSGDDRIDQLGRLAELRATGALTDEEFAAEKARVLGR
jgi:hypothetical protein